MKAVVGSRGSRQQRVEAMNDNTFLPSENQSKTFPPSLIAHVSGKIDESLAFVRERFANDAEAAALLSSLSSVDGQGLLQRLIASESISSNSKLAETANQLARALRVLPFDMINNLCDTDHRPETIRRVLDYYATYLKKNKEIFTTITQHHQKVKETDDWSKVATNTAALKGYSIMAHAMGDKAWVLEANWWMASYVQQFFFGDASAKFARKYLTPALCRSDADAHAAVRAYVHDVRTCCIPNASVQLSQEEAASVNPQAESVPGKAKVLDVGSCYNPLARSPDARFLDITAVDLHPSNKALDGTSDTVDSHYHVHTCDFLTVDVQDADDIEYTTSQDEAEGERVTTVQRIPRHFYHAVTMSLVLSYLPDPAARAVMVKKAYEVLQAKCGLFLIVEKDSIFKNINHPSMRTDPRGSWPIWKRAMWRLGFACVKYEHHRHSPVISASMVSSCARMSHIMVFVTRNQLPDPVPFTEEAYHVKKPNPSDGTEESKYSTSSTACSVEELEQLWIKQDLETTAAVPAVVGGHCS